MQDREGELESACWGRGRRQDGHVLAYYRGFFGPCAFLVDPFTTITSVWYVLLHPCQHWWNWSAEFLAALLSSPTGPTH